MPANLIAGARPFSIRFNDNNFGCGTKKCMCVVNGETTILEVAIQDSTKLQLTQAYLLLPWLVYISSIKKKQD